MIRIYLKMYDWRIIAGALSLWIVLTLVPHGFVADYFNLKQVISSGTFGRLTTAFISVFSFLVTVLVLTYGFLREKFRRLTLREFVENQFSRFLISFFISVFTVNIFSAIYLDSRAVDHNSLNVAYFSLSLSVIYFLSFLPLALVSIANTDSQALINKYVQKLVLDRFPQRDTLDTLTTHDEDNPLTVLVQLSRSYAERDDIHSVNTIIFLSQKRIEDLIDNSKDRVTIGRYFFGQRLIWDAVIQKAFQKKEYTPLNNVFLSLYLFHIYFSTKKIPLLFLEELRFFIHSLIERMVNEGLDESVEEAIVLYEKLLEHHYNASVPKEDDLPEVTHFFEQSEQSYVKAYGQRQLPKDDDANLQWMEIYSDIPYFFSIIVYKSIDKKNIALFNRAIGAIRHLVHSVHLSTMSERQKAWINRLLADEFYHFQILAFKKGVLIERIETLDAFIADRMIDENSLSKEFVLVSSSEFLIELHTIGRLDYDAINFLGSIGRHCANRYLENSSYRDSFHYILRVVEHLKELLEVDLKKDGKLYRWLKDAVESYVRFHKDPMFGLKLKEGEQKKVDNKLVSRIEELLKSFNPMDLKEETRRVEWDANGPREMYTPGPKGTTA